MLLFWKLVDETQMSKPPEHTRHHDSRKLLILLPLKAIYFSTFQYETPCSWPFKTVFHAPVQWGNLNFKVDFPFTYNNFNFKINFDSFWHSLSYRICNILICMYFQNIFAQSPINKQQSIIVLIKMNGHVRILKP